MKKDKTTYILVSGLFIVYLLLIIIAFYNMDKYSAVNANANNTFTVVIDAGHGGEDGGAVANGTVEKDINLSISNKLSDLLNSVGFNVITTRSTDTMLNTSGESLRERKVSDMKNRLDLFNSDNNNAVISIHQNLFTQEKYSGAQIFYSPNNPGSEKLAEYIKNNIVSLLQPDNARDCKKADKDIYLLYNANSPAVIVECGFISNYEEAQKLKDEKYQSEIAFAVFSGLLEYYNS